MIIDHVPTGGRYPPLLEVEVDIDANRNVRVVARVLGTDLEGSSDAETSTRPERPAALPIALSEPVAARQPPAVPGWYADPWGQHRLRYWDGAWTGWTHD